MPDSGPTGGHMGMVSETIALLTDETRPEGRALANTAFYLFDCALLRRIIAAGLLGIHFQRHKKEPDETGAVRSVTKFEYFLPDLYELASRMGAPCRVALLRDTARLDEPGVIRAAVETVAVLPGV